MKNFLIVLAVLFGCFLVACFLEFAINENFGRGFKGGASRMVAVWRDFDPGPLEGVQVTILPKRILVDLPRPGVAKRLTEEGHWTAHAFYVDSHLDAPAEIAIATEQRDGDLEIDLGHFLPEHPGKVTLVKFVRGGLEFDPYPVATNRTKVTYPPPKGLIQPGTLEWDLHMLPWRPDRIESSALVVHAVYPDMLSDGKMNKGYYPNDMGQTAPQESSTIYTYHSDRPDLGPLLVTVQHGKVIQVLGGAEETADPPYQFPSPPSDDPSSTPQNPGRN